MNWILIAISAGMIMTSSHETEEACLGREAMYKKEHKQANIKCVNMSNITYGTISGSICLTPGCR